MIVMILEKAPLNLRGELSRWLLEPASGVYIGHVSAMVRDQLWEKCCQQCKTGGVIQAWNTNNEQHFQLRVYGNPMYWVKEFEGLQLIQTQLSPEEQKIVARRLDLTD